MRGIQQGSYILDLQMIPNKPLVSIIIPTCNRPEYLIRSIKSVISQTFSFWECIIIDDCSKVSAKKVLKEFLELDKRFKIIRNSTPKFASEARNIGIRSSQGFYIAFLDDDDYWHSEKLQKQINFMQRNKYKVSYCWAYILKKNDEITVREPYLEGNIFDLMLAGQPLCNCSTLIAEKKVIEDIIDNVRKKTNYFYKKKVYENKVKDGRKAKTKSFLSRNNKDS